MELLLSHGADVNQQDNHGFTALILASFIGYTAILLLLSHGADMEEATADGATALSQAISESDDAVVKVLVLRCRVRARSRSEVVCIGDEVVCIGDKRFSKL